MTMFDLSVEQWISIIIAAFLTGFSKTGINNVMILVVAILATIFGGKESSGLLLPMLIVGDVFAVFYYKSNAEWGKIKKLLPWTIMGLLMGAIIGNYINDRQFKLFIAILVSICLVLLVVLERKKENTQLPNNTLVISMTGILAGFSTMIGNAAGPIFSIYLLAMGLKKQEYMGTTAWFFFIINITKAFFQIFLWNNITLNTLLLNGILIPIIAMGAVIGYVIIKVINEKVFHNIIIVMTAIAALRLFF